MAAAGDTVIVWFRRDLRLDDNPALVAAVQTAPNVIPVYIWSPEEEGQFQPGRYSRWWIKHSVLDFQRQLEALGSRLIIRRSIDSGKALMELVQETGAQAVFFNHLYDAISLVRDHEVKQMLGSLGVSVRSYNADLFYEPWEVLDDEDQPFTCFNGFWARVLSMPYPPPFPLSPPVALPPVNPKIETADALKLDWFMTPEQEMSSDQLRFKWKPGAAGAVEILERFLANRLVLFEHDRAKVDRESTSMLSPWIHVGTISVRYMYYRVRQAQALWQQQGLDKSQSCDDFLQQIGYREYSRYLSFHFPFIHERALLAHLRACPWRLDQQRFKAWRQGQTGYPLIDAAMRQLWSTGWAHNRMRVVASTFAVKNLLLPWQWGLKHFWDAQLDADLECDALGWQYVSGGMIDAKPFSYIMDLEAEAKRFDPDGEYIRRWLPVLARLPTEYIHAPWSAPPNVLAAADVELGFNYPLPIVSMEESVQDVTQACKVLERSLATSGNRASNTAGPYRVPTLDVNNSSGPDAGGGVSGARRPTPVVTGSGSGGPPGPPAGAGAPKDIIEYLRQGRHAARQAVHGVSASAGTGSSAPAGGSYKVTTGADPSRGMQQLQQQQRQQHKQCEGYLQRYQRQHHNAPGGDEDAGRRDRVAGRDNASGAGRMPRQYMYYQDDDEDEDSDSDSGAVSEEVVSNTVGLSATMATGCSGRAAVAQAASFGRQGPQGSAGYRAVPSMTANTCSTGKVPEVDGEGGEEEGAADSHRPSSELPSGMGEDIRVAHAAAGTSSSPMQQDQAPAPNGEDEGPDAKRVRHASPVRV